MFGRFRKAPRAGSGTTFLMGWRVLTCQQGDSWFSLQIEPMLDGPCRVYVPGPLPWQAQAPAWARDRREALLQEMAAEPWNRELAWPAGDACRFWHQHADQPVEGSLESTPGGRQLQGMRLFHIESARRFTRQQARQAWCTGAEQMCLQARGNVNIDQSEVVPGSVFQRVELPALQRNPHVTLNFKAAA